MHFNKISDHSIRFIFQGNMRLLMDYFCEGDDRKVNWNFGPKDKRFAEVCRVRRKVR